LPIVVEITVGTPNPPALAETLKGFRVVVDQAAREILALKQEPRTPPR